MEVKEKLNFGLLFRTFWQPEEQEIPEMDDVLSSDILSQEDIKALKEAQKQVEKLEAKHTAGTSNSKSTRRTKANIQKVDSKISVREIKENNLEKDEGIERE